MLQLLRQRSAFLLAVLMVLCVPIAGWTQSITKEAAKAAKVSPDLYQVMTNRGQLAPAVIGGFSVQTNQVFAGDKVAIEAIANNEDGAGLLNQLRSLGLTNGVAHKRMIFGYLPVDKLAELKNVSSLSFARSYYKPETNVGSVTSQGDAALKADLARTTYGVTGAGVKVGVISDSYNNLGGAAAGVASNDLPAAGVQVLLDLTSGGSDEGRAMAEIVHDVAPGADIAFNTAFNGQAGFAQGIIDLAAAGCKVIVDDIIYFAEPFFQDGIIAQAADQVVTAGSAYFSAAGNQARSSYQAAYKSGGTYTNPSIYSTNTAYPTHDFGTGGVDNLQQITIPAGGQLRLAFQWDNPFQSVSGGVGATTDLDILVLDAATGNVIGGSASDQSAGGDPVEITGTITNTTGSPRLVNVVVVKYAGPDPGLIKWVNFGSRSIITEYDTKSSSSFGHSNSTKAVSVGAAPYFNTPVFNAASTATIENFSSAGGTPILFTTTGDRINGIVGTVRQKPEITSVDGGDNTFFGGDYEPNGRPNFFGTSAAAPHAAAVAALMKEKVPAITPATILSTLKSTALDMDDPAFAGFETGFDFGTGYGFIQADRALQAITSNAAPTVANVIAPQSGTVGVGFSFTIPANTFSDPNGDALSYTVTGLPMGLTFAGTTISGTPSVDGTSTVTVKATDPGSLSASTTFQLTISPAPVVPPANTAPTVANVIAPQSGTVGVGFSFTIPANTFVDPEGQALSYTVTGLPPGLSASVVGISGTFSAPASEILISGTPSMSGVSTVSVTATDPGSLSASTTFQLTISPAPVVPPANTAPTVANVIAPQSGTVGVGFNFTIPANTFSDPEGQALSYTVTGLPPGLSASVVGISGTFSAPASEILISGTPSVSGVSTVSVTATDPGSLSANTTFQLTISPASVVPPTGPFSITGVTTVKCTPLSEGKRTVSFTPEYAGLTGQPISFSVTSELLPTTAPGPYTLSLYIDNPSVTLKATQTGTAGEASFVYNWLAACIAGTPPPVNMPPVASTPANQTAVVGQPFTYAIPAFTDPNGDALTYTVSGLPAGLSASGNVISGTPSMSGVSTVSVTASDPGSLSASTSFMLTVISAPVVVPPTGPFSITGVTTVKCTPLSEGKRTVSFTPQYAGLTGQPISFSVVSELLPTTAPGPYSLSLYIDNPSVTLKATQTGTAGEASFVYNWLAACIAGTPPPVNLPPVASTPANQTAIVSQPFTYTIPANTFVDPNGDALTYMVAGLPAGLSASGSVISGTPSVTGVSTVTVTATDPGSLSASASFMLTVISAPVTPPPAGPFSITGVTTVKCTPLSEGKRTVSFTPEYAGLTGQPISFSVTSELLPTTAPGPYTLSLYIDNPSVTLKATQTGTVGEASFVYNWLAACIAGTPPPVNLPPVASTPANQTAVVSQPFTYVIPAFTDPNGDALTYTVSGLPTGLSASGNVISGTPSMSGVSTVSVTASDPGSLSASTSFMLTVISAPVVVPPTGPFSITGVTTVKCTPLSEGKRTVSFTPEYAGLTGQPISFSVTNELSPTTAPGPYTLSLYTDNPSVTLKATQMGTAGEASFVYNWLAACNAPARQGMAGSGELQAKLTVSLYPNPVGEEFSIGIKGAQGQKVGIILSDVSGRALTNTSVDVTTPDHQERLRFNQERPGLYLLRVSAGGQMVVLKVIKH